MLYNRCKLAINLAVRENKVNDSDYDAHVYIYTQVRKLNNLAADYEHKINLHDAINVNILKIPDIEHQNKSYLTSHVLFTSGKNYMKQ